MNLLYYALLTFNSLILPGDTLRYDGYYLKVSEQATSWKVMYFLSEGRYKDTTGVGTPPAFEEGTLIPLNNTVYTIEKDKDEYKISFETVNLPLYDVTDGPIVYRCRFENDEMVITATRQGKQKWKKVKERYSFIPY